MSKVAEILANPKQFGFEFKSETCRKGRFACEVPHVTDLQVFDTTFNGAALRAVNGTSIRVGAQAVAERVGEKPTGSRERVRTAVVEWLLEIEQPSVKYVAVIDGVKKYFATEEELDEALLELA